MGITTQQCLGWGHPENQWRLLSSSPCSKGRMIFMICSSLLANMVPFLSLFLLLVEGSNLFICFRSDSPLFAVLPENSQPLDKNFKQRNRINPSRNLATSPLLLCQADWETSAPCKLQTHMELSVSRSCSRPLLPALPC